jgi:hypothetical protein
VERSAVSLSAATPMEKIANFRDPNQKRQPTLALLQEISDFLT